MLAPENPFLEEVITFQKCIYENSYIEVNKSFQKYIHIESLFRNVYLKAMSEIIREKKERRL